MRHQVSCTLLSIVLSLFSEPISFAQEITINVRGDQVLHKVSRYLTGACIEDVNHEIYGGIFSQMIFGESFQEPPASSSVAGFRAFGGRWEVMDGTLRVDASDGPKLISDCSPVTDGEVGVDLRFSDRKGQNAGLIVRVTKASTGPDRFFGYEVSVDPKAQRLRLARHRNNFELIKDIDCVVPVGKWFPVQVKLHGSTVVIVVDGKEMLRQDDGNKSLPRGGIGLRAWNCQASYRNLWVKSDQNVQSLSFNPSERNVEISGMWQVVKSGTATGQARVVTDNAFAGTQSQRITFDSGDGAWGMENQGLNRWGMNFVEGKPYDGYIWARAEKPATIIASLESRDGKQTYAEVSAWTRETRLATARLHAHAESQRPGWPICTRIEAARLGRRRPCVSPTRRMGPIQGPSGPTRRRRRTDRPGNHRAPVRRFDGQ